MVPDAPPRQPAALYDDRRPLAPGVCFPGRRQLPAPPPAHAPSTTTVEAPLALSAAAVSAAAVAAALRRPAVEYRSVYSPTEFPQYPNAKVVAPPTFFLQQRHGSAAAAGLPCLFPASLNDDNDDLDENNVFLSNCGRSPGPERQATAALATPRPGPAAAASTHFLAAADRPDPDDPTPAAHHHQQQQRTWWGCTS
jgi:hypothetical protein